MTHRWRVTGHDWAVDHLRASMAHGRVRHAYLIVGADGVGKAALALTFAMALNCQNPDGAQNPCYTCSACTRILSGNYADVILVEGESGALKIDEVRALIQKLSLKPYEARMRIAILAGFESARGPVQDALLKTLEEPPAHAILILLATSIEPVLPTITSRSQVLSLRLVSADAIAAGLRREFPGADVETIELAARLSGGRYGWARTALHDGTAFEQRAQALVLLHDLLRQNRAGRFALAESLARDKPSLVPLLGLWQTFWRDVVLREAGSDLPIANIDQADALDALAARVSPDQALAALQATRRTLGLLETNANMRLALEVMFLDYPLPA